MTPNTNPIPYITIASADFGSGERKWMGVHMQEWFQWGWTSLGAWSEEKQFQLDRGRDRRGIGPSEYEEKGRHDGYRDLVEYSGH